MSFFWLGRYFLRLLLQSFLLLIASIYFVDIDGYIAAFVSVDVQVDKAPLESYSDVGGLDKQIQEVKEAVELPLSHPELYDEMGIRPPKGDIFSLLFDHIKFFKSNQRKSIANKYNVL